MGLLSIIDAIPFVGKYKTVTGAVVTATGGVLQLVGVDAGAEVQNWGTALMGLGIAHARAKAKHQG